MSEKMLSLKEIQSIEYSILLKFHEFCEVHQLNYMLTYGTLLGAVRHKGFIPWDDDVDVMMPREDYERFILLFHSVGINDMEILSSEKSEYYYPFIKLCDTRTVAKMEDNKTEHGIWMDIFPIDNVPNSQKQCEYFHKKIRFYKNVVIAFTTDFVSAKKNMKLLAKIFFSICGNLKGKKKITRILEKECIKYNAKDTGLYSAVVWQTSIGGNMTKKDISERKKLLFVDKYFFVPNDYTNYLESLYHNYMQLPPEDNRKTHYLIAYRKFENRQ